MLPAKRGDSMKEVILGALLFGLFISAVMWGANKMEAAQCEARWSHVGKGVDYAFIQGCMVTLSDGRRLPASALRDVDVR